jgi:cell filamentation protein
MYDAVKDKYCYPGTHVLKNLPGLRRQAELRRFELAMTTQRFDEPLPHGRFSVSHYRAIHHHLFQDVYSWAGRFRTVRIAKDRSSFCYPENIAREMRDLFSGLRNKQSLRGRTAEQFATDVRIFSPI